MVNSIAVRQTLTSSTKILSQSDFLLYSLPLLCLIALGFLQHDFAFGDQRYEQYINKDTKAVTTPKGFSDNDDCFRSSWFYASLIVIHAKDHELYKKLQVEHGVDISSVKDFLIYFRDNCLGPTEWKRPTTLKLDFSRDQLAPLLYLLGCVKAFQPEGCEAPAKDILADLVRLVKERRAVSNTSGGRVGGNLRYVIDVDLHQVCGF